jgi:hypothetical protein
MQFIMKKRRRRKREEIISTEQESELLEEEVSRNWKNRRGKPPDKIIAMNYRIISRKEYNRLYEDSKMNKTRERREKYYNGRMKGIVLPDQKSLKINQNGRCIGYDVKCEAEKELEKMQLYRSIVRSINHAVKLVKS